MWPDNSGYSGWFNPQYLMPYGAPAGQQQPMQSQGNWWDWWTRPQPVQQSPQQQQHNQMSQFGQQGMNMLKPPPQMAPQPFQLGGGQMPQTDPNLFATPGMPPPPPGMPATPGMLSPPPGMPATPGMPGAQQNMYGALAPGRTNMMDPRLRQQMMMRQFYGQGY